MKIKLSKNLIFILFLLIPFFKPIGLSYFTIINNSFKVWKLIAMIIIMYIIVKKLLKNKKVIIDKNFLGLFLFWLIYLINCLINKTDYTTVLSNAISIFLIFEFIHYECEIKKGNELLNALEILFTIYLILQIISVFYINITHRAIFEPIYNDYIYFLGTDNYSAFQIIPMLTIIIYNNALRKEILCFKNIFLLIMVIICNIFTKSYTAIFASVILFVIIILNKKIKNILNFFSIKKIIFIYCLLLILILGFNIQYIFANLLENQIEKGVSLNSRTIIWKNSLELIKTKILFGYGTLSNDMIKSYVLYGAGHAHNFLLELLLRTGIVGTISYIVFLLKTISKDLLSNESKILYGGLLVFLILSFMDFYPEILYLYLLIGIMYYWKKFKIKEN